MVLGRLNAEGCVSCLVGYWITGIFVFGDKTDTFFYSYIAEIELLL